MWDYLKAKVCTLEVHGPLGDEDEAGNAHKPPTAQFRESVGLRESQQFAEES